MLQNLLRAVPQPESYGRSRRLSVLAFCVLVLVLGGRNAPNVFGQNPGSNGPSAPRSNAPEVPQSLPNAGSSAQVAAGISCWRAAEGSTVSQPANLYSQNGILKVELAFRSDLDTNGQTRYCYVAKDGSQAPTLHVNPADTLVLLLKNEISLPSSSSMSPPGRDSQHTHSATANVAHGDPSRDPCAGGVMTATSTNLHFHGLVLPPVCHQDDTLKTLIQSGDPQFEYRIQIPKDTPPGMYWYHPHAHGFTKAQVLGGASGALVVEGIEQANPALSGVAEQILVVRDQDLVYPNAEPVHSGSVPPPILPRDAEGDTLNTGTGEGKPAEDLSINYVPVPYPQYPPAILPMPPRERQLWRLLNACAITYLDVQLLVNEKPQMLGVVALDGIPLSQNGLGGSGILWQSHILIPPAGRAEFIVRGLPDGVKASLVTRSVDTGPAGENDPTRPLATILVSPGAATAFTKLPTNHEKTRADERASTTGTGADSTPQAPRQAWLGDVKPARERRLYFSEEPQNQADPNSPTKFYVTVEGETPAQFDPRVTTPNITVRQGDVEDWIIENRSTELHAFHIHQIHFLLKEWNGVPLDEPFLRDTVNVAYWDGRSPDYPRVKLRMDFRDSSIIGTFVYHCHLLEHEDGGMMGTIQVLPREKSPRAK